jgi:hypothetical protein
MQLVKYNKKKKVFLAAGTNDQDEVENFRKHQPHDLLLLTLEFFRKKLPED